MNIQNLNRAQLLDIYNDAAGKLGLKALKSFKDLTTAKARTASILASLPKTKTARPKKTFYGPRMKTFLPSTHATKTAPVPGSMRHEAYELLRVGCMFDEVEKVVVKHSKIRGSATQATRAYRLVLDMWHQFGFGIKQDPTTGVIKIYR